ncbi:unnamed protein product [Clonostachys rosea f. rosea IK726]|uniref:Uncharacterized protein n=1 Tax=Clonostachys rosea f. rosea IK726 TaxID=1349383 RepID=A0ACA9UM26_BIOOC|nr:unnamed protein product [Clonostachys rosea f. rosea IK726]
MPADTTNSARRQQKRQKASRDAGMAEANVTKCVEDPELSSDSRAIASQILVKAVDNSTALRAAKTSQAGKRFESESGNASSLALRSLGATESQHIRDDQPSQEMIREWQQDTETRIERIRNSEAAGICTAEQAKAHISAIRYSLKKLIESGQHDEVEPTTLCHGK